MSVALATAPVEQKKIAVKLHPTGLGRADYARALYRISPPPRVEYEDVLKPIYWHHIADTLRPGDLIEVLPEDRTYYAELLVVQAGDNSAKVEEIRFKKFEVESVEPAAIPVGYDVDWRGPNGRYAAIRLHDKAVVQANFKEKADAYKWLIDNRKTLS